MIFLVPGSIWASARSSRYIGLSGEYYTGNVLLAELDLGLGDHFRLGGGVGKSLDSAANSTVFKTGLKYLFFSSDFAPYLGVEFWHVSASVSSYSFSASAIAAVAGIDFVSSNGFHLAFGAIHFLAFDSFGGMVSLGYFF
jgi:hypothetical protein